MKNTSDNYEIGFYYFRLHSSVAKRRVGLRQLVKNWLRLTDAALVVFDDGSNWRLSFICDLKDDATAPKRFTFVFGDAACGYHTPVSRFLTLQQSEITFKTLRDAFSVEALTKEFYQQLFAWYQWAVSPEAGVTFPNNTKIEEDDREKIDIKIIRLITRLMFVWFIRQKDLVPQRLFDPDYLQTILRDFDPQSTLQGNYYNAILQNLFFATLNRAIKEDDGTQRRFAKAAGVRDIKTLYRYAEMFRISEDEVIKLFSEIPFLNGGLFECLDKNKTQDGVEVEYYNDGFSRNAEQFKDGHYKYRAFVPNNLFFDPDRGLFALLNRYNFTIEENTPSEQQVALDPELLGKVFENLLGAYNPETQETARNQSGSFYTPREIVNYMVDESLLAYLGNTDTARNLLSDNFVKDPAREAEYKDIAKRLKAIRILDPACGSGAFPMGLLNRLVDLLQKIQPEADVYTLKLQIIENCLYGSDIQPIAAQITKLRFFISLICDCEKDSTKPNFGIPTLPNLETKFVTANSLIAKKKRPQQGILFEDPRINETKQALHEIRHQHFQAKSASQKRRLRDKDEQLRRYLAQLLEDNRDFSPADAQQLAQWNPYDQNAVSPFFDPEWMFGLAGDADASSAGESGCFDIVIGNPPYIQLQKNGGALGRLYQSCNFATFDSGGDIYCLFYERGQQLLRAGGHLCYITSNKWMRAGYGEKTREFFANHTNPKLLIDFAGVKIFESATVDTNILLFAKEPNQHHTICAVTNKQNKDSVHNLSVFVQQQHTVCDFSGSDSWVILSPIEQSIKRKIESVGTPLKDWDIQINYGIKTGYNVAFIISTAKRNEILSNTADYVAGQAEKYYAPAGEYARTAALIRPILRGRDIKRYGYNWAELWLINTHNGVKENGKVKIPRIDINDYPAVKAHLDTYWDKIKNRADQGDTPYNLRNCAYIDDFNQPKIVYIEIMTDNIEEGYPFPCFSYDENKSVVLNTGYIMCSKTIDVRNILGILNSTFGRFFVKLYVSQLQSRQFRMLAQYVNNFRIPKSCTQDNAIAQTTGQIISLSQAGKDTKELETKLNQQVYHLYGLSDEEIKYIDGL